MISRTMDCIVEKPMINTDGMTTDDVLGIARDALAKKELRDVVVASTQGNTGVASAKLFGSLGVNLVVVAHSIGFRGPNTNEFSPDMKNEIQELGGSVLFSTMPFHSINDAIRAKMGSSIETLIADTLRMMGHGTKVCAEIVAMACDAGLVESDRKVLAIAGTGRGADTVLIVKSANSRRFFDLKIVEVLAKPQTI
jgi:uncharacterized protein